MTDHTRVCSRHFKAADYLPSLTNRKRILKPATVPSVFNWMKGSPVKRKSPKKRNPTERKTSVEGSKTMTAEVTNVNFTSTCVLLSTVSEKEFETSEDFPSTDSKGESSAGQTSVEDLELIIRNLNIEIERHKEENGKISFLLDNLKLEIKVSTRRNATLQARVISVDRFLESDKDFNFYTRFPGRFVFEKLYEFLDLRTEGENINYWHSTEDLSCGSPKDLSQSCSDTIPKQGRPRILGPKDEFFPTICRLRQGFKEEHLGHLYSVSQTTFSRMKISWINFMF